MIKKLLLLLLFGVAGFSPILCHAMDGYLNPVQARDATFWIKASSITASQGSFVFPGYATTVNYFAQYSSAVISTNYTIDGSTFLIAPGQTIYTDFSNPTSSPTIITYQLYTGGVLNITVGGLKTDK